MAFDQSRYLTRILLAFGDAEDAEAGLPWASTLARSLHLPLTLVHLLEPGATTAATGVALTPAQEALLAEDLLQLLEHDQRLQGIEVDSTVLGGPVVARLADLAASVPGGLLVFVREVGSVRIWRAVVQALRSPFAVLPPPSDAAAQAPGQVHRLVVGVDRSEVAERLLHVSEAIGHGLGVDVIAVEAVEPDATDAAAFLAEAPQLAARRVRMRGLASRTLLAVARTRQAELILVGSHGYGGTSDPTAGRTTNWLLQHADRPVVVVPQARVRARQRQEGA